MSASDTPPRRPFELLRERDGARLRPDETASRRPEGGDGRTGLPRRGVSEPTMAPRPGAPEGVRRWESEQDRAPAGTAVEGPNLGQILLAARMRRGVDLERAQRDTKIRARYLAALEAGDFRELPGTVYTKGFLRNYAQYLDLDPDAVVELYRGELGSRASEPVTVVPRALEAPRRRFTFTSGLIIAGVLVIIVLAFAAYIGVQLFRFAKPPELVVTSPPQANLEIDAETLVMAGTASPGATVSITGPDGQPVRITAAADGAWSREVALRKGRNEFLLLATDPATSKSSEAVTLIITVPIPVIEAPTLSLSSPNDGTSFTNGAIPMQGTTSGDAVVVSAEYLGPAVPVPDGQPTPAPPPVPPARELEVSGDGSFSGAYDLTAGTWRLTVTATGQENKQTTETRSVTVAYTGVNLVVEIRGGNAWLVVRVDGVDDPKTNGGAGRTFRDGSTIIFAGQEQIEIRTGAASVTYVTVNGTPYGPLGERANPGTWVNGPSGPPQPVS